MQTHSIKDTGLSPLDEFNQKLISNVQPPDWVNPTPASRYNLVVIGAGTAGLICAAGAAGLGAKVALIEKRLLGGDCLNYGCVPSKSIIRSSRVFAEAKDASRYGVFVPQGTRVDFPEVMQRMRRIRAQISANDAAKRFRDLGVDVFLGEAHFLDAHSVQVAGKELKFKKAVITSGARPVVPPLEGLAEAGFLTNETIFNLTELPKRFGIIGAGPIGCEMAQAFTRFGSKVTLLGRAPQILGREDQDAAKILQSKFEKEGVQILLKAKLIRITRGPEGKVIYYEKDGKAQTVAVDEILMGVGRAPNVDSLNLDLVGIKNDKKKGVEVNDYLQTTLPHVYAAGDICLAPKFTHTAEASARIVIQNALFGDKKKFSDLVIPWCTYTDPEVAHTGMYEKDAQERGISVETFVHSLKDVDRAVTDGEEDGFIKIHVKKGTDIILGATIVAKHAGEIISEVTLAINARAGLKTISNVIHPYPTQAEGIRAVANAYNRTRLKPWMKKLLMKWFEWKR